MPYIERTCCFSGHRPDKLPWGYNEADESCIFLKKRIYDACEAAAESGVTHFVCGMARGCDMYFFEAILKLRSKYPGITLEAAVPCRNQANGWPMRDKIRYEAYLGDCDIVNVLSEKYTRECMAVRNRYMVDKSSILVAVFEGGHGGTMQTINYAKKKELKIIQLRP